MLLTFQKGLLACFILSLIACGSGSGGGSKSANSVSSQALSIASSLSSQASSALSQVSSSASSLESSQSSSVSSQTSSVVSSVSSQASSVSSSVSSQASSVVSSSASSNSSSSSNVSSSSSVSSSAASSTPETISGKAAAGAPIVGTVWVKDSNGTVRNSAIELDGSYSLNVTGMTAPLLLNARGTVGGRTVNFSSIAQNADLGGNINITPFTDLIMANVIGQITQNYFDSPNFAQLSDSQVEAARAQVTARLQPVLSALGLAAGLDLMRESFNTDHTGLDAALDVLRVEPDPANNTMTITNVLTQQQIVDDVTSSSDTSSLPNPGSLVAALSDFDAIMVLFDTFAAQFATSVPSDNAPAFLALFDAPNYLEGGGTDPNQILHDDPGTAWTFGNYSIVEKISDTQWLISATMFVDDQPINEVAEWYVNKVNGVWKIAGDQQQSYVDVYGQVWRDFNSGQWHYDSHFELDIESFNTNVRYVVIEGPGLNYQYPSQYNSAKGMVFDLSVGGLLNADGSDQGEWLRDCAAYPNVVCFTRAEVEVGRHYSVRTYDSSWQQIGSSFLRPLYAIPPTVSYAQTNAASLFPLITGVRKGDNPITNLAQATAGGDLTVTWTLPEAVGICMNTVGYQVEGSAGYEDSRADDVACDATSGTVTTTAYSGTATWSAVWIWLEHPGGIEYGGNQEFKP
jgi:hypothetical protein